MPRLGPTSANQKITTKLISAAVARHVDSDALQAVELGVHSGGVGLVEDDMHLGGHGRLADLGTLVSRRGSG